MFERDGGDVVRAAGAGAEVVPCGSAMWQSELNIGAKANTSAYSVRRCVLASNAIL